MGRLATSVVMEMAFGYEIPPNGVSDRLADLADETGNGVDLLFLPESTLINVFPILKHIPPWVPGATTQKFAHGLRKMLDSFRNEPFEILERQLVRIFFALPISNLLKKA